MLCNILHYTYIESLKQSHSFLETFLKVNFTSHGTLCNCFYLITDTCSNSKFVNTLCLYKS